MNVKYIVHYLYGNVGGQVGCSTFNQSKEIAEGIVLWVKTTTGKNAEISIQNVETGDLEPFFY